MADANSDTSSVDTDVEDLIHDLDSSQLGPSVSQDALHDLTRDSSSPEGDRNDANRDGGDNAGDSAAKPLVTGQDPRLLQLRGVNASKTSSSTVSSVVSSHRASTELRNFFVRSRTMDRIYGDEGFRRKELSHLHAALGAQVQRIAVVTSGGDSQGMNACVRAVVRCALNKGVEVFVAWNGYQGLVDGGDHIKEVLWGDVGGILNQGGTFIGTARCSDFRRAEGRRMAVANLLRQGIYNLIIVGGDGSLTGADLLFKEWKEHTHHIAENLAKFRGVPPPPYPSLRVVGTVGSIDNDMCGTDFTIGCDTALKRIVDAVDILSSTAASHQRDFVVEVMGRHCGWLGVTGALATGADWLFIPEYPYHDANWEKRMVRHLTHGRKRGKRSSIVIVSEGAIDRNGDSIGCETVKKILDDGGLESRITILLHSKPQRSGVRVLRNVPPGK